MRLQISQKLLHFDIPYTMNRVTIPRRIPQNPEYKVLRI